MILRKYNYVNNIMKSFSRPPAYPERRANWTSSGEITVFAVGNGALDVPRGKQFLQRKSTANSVTLRIHCAFPCIFCCLTRGASKAEPHFPMLL